jgi:hypothetical protein
MATPSFEATPPADTPRSLLDIFARIFRSWDRFWFAPGDPTTLGLIRICAGAITLYVHLVYTLDLQTLVGRDAWISTDRINEFRHDIPVVPPPDMWVQPQVKSDPLPSDEARANEIRSFMQTWNSDPRLVPTKGIFLTSIWYHVTDPTWMAIIHGFVLVAMFMFTIGLCTRVTSALTWLAALSYVQRAPTTLFGMDTMMMIALFYLMIGPSGAALSVDRLLRRWWARRQAERLQLAVPAWEPPSPSVTANFALRLIQIHFCIIYAASGLSKLQGAQWWSGTALWGTMANYEFNPLDWARYQDFLVFLSSHRWLWELVTSGGVAFTILLEISFPFLIWRRSTRWVMIICAVFLHTGISMTMGLTTFGLMMLAMLLSFVPAAAVRQLLNTLAGWRRPTEPAPALAA